MAEDDDRTVIVLHRLPGERSCFSQDELARDIATRRDLLQSLETVLVARQVGALRDAVAVQDERTVALQHDLRLAICGLHDAERQAALGRMIVSHRRC